MTSFIFWLIIIIISIDFLFEKYLSYLNNKYRLLPLSEEAQGIYDAEKYKKSQRYEHDKERLSLVSSTFSYVLTLFFLFFNGFYFLDNYARHIVEHPIYTALIFFGLMGFVLSLISIPFSYYQTFVIEERYGFNKTNLKTFILDILKSWFISIVIGLPIMAFLIWSFDGRAYYMWIVAWIGIGLFMLFFTFFYSELIVPLFNKQKPLEKGELRDAIEAFSQKVDFSLKDIYVIDGSKRSAKANAYFTGFGSKKRIVLYDTLIEQLNTDELVAVLAHEIGHYKKKHVVKNIVLSILSLGVSLFVLSVFITYPVFSLALGVEIPSFHVSLVSFGILYGFISSFQSVFLNMYSRKNEYEADRFAALYYNADALASALKKLTVTNLSNLQPHPWYVFVYYSHPPIVKRLRFLKQL